jgi:tripartite-type tricarboxylate transporter receptor subunit TctC
MFTRRTFFAGAAGLSSLALAAPRGRAQPGQRTTRIVVGFAAGGGPDTVARLLAENLKSYASTVIVENRPGAGGRLALEFLKTAPADGSVVVITPGDQLALFPHIYKSLNYDPLRDFVPVTTVGSVQFLLAVGPLVPASVNSLNSFIAWCKANPTAATYGTPGAGTRHHFFGQMLARAANIELVHAPYRGAPPAIQDLIAGQIAAVITVTSNALPHVATGRLRVLATTAPRRSKQLPDVPTVREAGFAALEAVEWFGMLVPRGTPEDVVAALNAATREALATSQVREALDRLAVEVGGSTPAEYRQLIEADFANWPGTVKATGFNALD